MGLRLPTTLLRGMRGNNPAHLAERWEGMTVEEAEEEWKRVYRDHPYDANPAGMVLGKD